MARRKIEVQIVGDADSLHRALGKATDTTSRFGRVAGAVGRAGALALGAGAVVAAVGLKKAIDAGSDMNETLNKVNVVFGKSSEEVQAFGDQAAVSLGISKQGALDAAATFGTFGKAAGVSQAALGSWSDQLVVAAGDLASFHNADPTQVLEDIRSGLAGEVEPLRKYGILLNDAALRQQALKMGLVSTTKDALSPNNKMLAAQALILKNLGPAAGDFARTSSGLANQQRIMKAELQDVVSELGTALLPVVLKIVQFAAPLLISALQTITRLTTEWGPSLAHASDAAGGFQNRVVAAFKMVWHWIQANIIPIVIRLKGVFQQSMTAIAQVVSANGPELQRIFSRLGAAVRAVGVVAIPILKFALVQVLPRAIGIAIQILDRLTSVVQSVAHAVQWIGSHAAAAFNAFKNAVTRASNAIMAVLNPIISALTAIISKIQWVTDHIPDIPSSIGGIHIPGLGGGLIPGVALPGGGSSLPSRGGGGQGRPMVVQVVLDRKVLAQAVVAEDKDYTRQNGRGLFAT